MGKRCCMCGINTIFYVWTTSRTFPMDSFLSHLGENIKNIDPDVVCFSCLNKLKDHEEV